MRNSCTARAKWLGLTAAVLAGAVGAMAPGLVIAGDTEEYAISARRGYFSLVGWEFGPLGAMAKGEMPYDAAAASAHAANLKLLTGYNVLPLFLPGTDKASYTGKTRVLAKLWEEIDDAKANHEKWISEIDTLASVAGNGQEALAKQVKAVGKTCGGCHKPYRAKKF